MWGAVDEDLAVVVTLGGNARLVCQNYMNVTLARQPNIPFSLTSEQLLRSREGPRAEPRKFGRLMMLAGRSNQIC